MKKIAILGSTDPLAHRRWKFARANKDIRLWESAPEKISKSWKNRQESFLPVL